MIRQPCWLDDHASCCYGGYFCLRRSALADFCSIGCSPRSSMHLWLFSFLRCGFVCVWTGTFGRTSSAIDFRLWGDPLFSSARDPLIPGWSYINSATTWRMRTFHHTSEPEKREPYTASFTNYRWPRWRCPLQLCCPLLFFTLDELHPSWWP